MLKLLLNSHVLSSSASHGCSLCDPCRLAAVDLGHGAVGKSLWVRYYGVNRLHTGSQKLSVFCL